MHEHHHDRDHQRQVVGRKLVISTSLMLLFFGFELGAGIWSNSLALVGDAFHNLTDSMALGLALAAMRLERRPPTHTKSFGYHRAGVLAAFVNAGVLVALTLFLVVEAWERFQTPQTIDSTWMLAAATVALALNTALTLWLRNDSKHDLSVRSAVLHLFADAVSSVGVIAAALLINATGANWIDPFVSLLIAVLILWSAWGILRETINLLLEGTPSGIDPQQVINDLAREDGVYGVHHLHIWAIAPSRPALSCHLMLGDVTLKSTGEILSRVNAMLAERYRIAHTTIQFEYAGCPLDDPFCTPRTSDE